MSFIATHTRFTRAFVSPSARNASPEELVLTEGIDRKEGQAMLDGQPRHFLCPEPRFRLMNPRLAGKNSRSCRGVALRAAKCHG